MTTQNNDGGPAFPRSRDSWPDPDNPALADISDEQEGMTLRAYFAAQALPAMIGKTSPGTGVPFYLSKAVADGCVAYADALLERLGLVEPLADNGLTPEQVARNTERFNDLSEISRNAG